MKMYKSKFIRSSILGIAVVVLGSGCASTSSKADAGQEKVAAEQTDSSSEKTTSAENKDVTTEDKETSEAHVQLIEEIYQLAKVGKVPGADFVSGKDLIDKVHQSWGNPDKPLGEGDPYEVYNQGTGSGEFAFGVGRGEVIYDIRYFGSGIDPSVDFSQISFNDIEQTLGKPNEIRKNKEDDILVYKVGEYELKFVGPSAEEVLHHISVYSPKAAEPMGGK